MKSSVRTFKLEEKIVKGLTATEKKILPILVQAVKQVDKIFLVQENDLYKGANLYPHDATREEIEQAAEDNSRIFSPFTIVKRDNTGKLIAIDYHKEYSKVLASVSSLLQTASKHSDNKSFKRYLETLSMGLAEGKYQESDRAWLAIKDSNIEVIIGPHERYIDKLFFIKRAYQASVGIIDREKTQRAKFIRDIFYTTTGYRPQRITPPSIVDVQVQNCIVMSGFLGRAIFSRQHLPSDTETTERYGSRILGYLSAIDFKFERFINPIFNAIFEKNFRASYSKKLLEEGNYYYVLLTAIAQQLHRYRNSRSRLKELFPILDEANSVVSGITHAKHLVLKGVIDQKTLEAIMIAQICWAFSEWILYRTSNLREDYLKGDALIFNFLIREGALQEKSGISWPNFAKMFFEMENLAVIFTRFLEEGGYLDAQEFLSKYLSLEPFKDFDQHLIKIKPL